MKSLRLAVWLMITSTLLAACGGGGDASSPDVPGLSIDPSTLRLEFVDSQTLPGNGKSTISVRMMALRSDGFENFKVGPEKNITDQVSWTLSQTTLASPVTGQDGKLAFRDYGNGKGLVIDIQSTEQLSVDATASTVNLKGTFKSGSDDGDFTIIPPRTSGGPVIQGKDLILLDPADPNDSETTGYRLLQYFQNADIPENRTPTVLICSNDNTIAQPQTATQGTEQVAVKFVNPFSTGSDNLPRDVILFAVDKETNDSCPVDIPDGAPTKTITLRAATFEQVDICTIINPADAVCNSISGDLNTDVNNGGASIDSCKGLDLDEGTSLLVPAAQRLQFVARYRYNSATDGTTTLEEYRCTQKDDGDDSNNAVWSTDANGLIFEDAPDAEAGFATTKDRVAYAQYVESQGKNPISIVSGNFRTGIPEMQDSLQLELVDARVDAVKIERTDGKNADGSVPDTLYVNSFLDGIEYRAMCRFVELGVENADYQPCPDGLVTWESSKPAIATPTPTNTVTTTLNGAQPTAQTGAFELTVTYIGSDEEISGSRNVTAVDPGALQALRMFMVPNNSKPDEAEIDAFACVGRDDLVSSVSNDEDFVHNGQQFEVYAVFENIPNSSAPNLDNPNDPNSGLVYVTPEDEIQFSAVSGFWSGTWADPASCESAYGEGGLPDLTEDTDGIIVTSPAASFDPNQKGRLQSDGLLRLSTVCVTAFAEESSIPNRAADLQTQDGVVMAEDGSTILVLPAADDTLLARSNDLCETLEPVLTLGGGWDGIEGPGVILPLIYGVSLVADPLLASLTTNDDGGMLPVEEILDGLLYGDFTGLSEDAPDLGFGLATITDGLINGMEGVPGLGLLVDFLDSCLLSQTLDFLGNLLTGILTFDAGAFEDIADINFDNCAAIFEGGL